MLSIACISDGEVRACNDILATQILMNLGQAMASVAVFISETQFMFRPRNILGGHGSELVDRSQFRRQHLSKCGRQPYISHISGDVCETHHGYRSACETRGNDRRRLSLRGWHVLTSTAITIPRICDE